MTIDRRKFPFATLHEDTSISDPPLPGEQSPALTYALSMMDTYVSEQFGAMAAETAVPSSRVTQLLQTAAIGVEGRRRDAIKRLSQLTSREADVLGGLADGKNTKSIAFDMNISPKTVEIHRSRIMKKLDCDSLFELGRIWEAALSANDIRTAF
ncbi:response regulator transcription factor [Azospirillum sp. TSA6c]|uniref:response regulator transcription factor n=1 Tax=unclassified Azospirillum TaxID=2630922 RepID=UPI000D65E9F4|nr:LuxR C-terminal-related transcriptional regulator [Azospirillum sp. TSA6c]